MKTLLLSAVIVAMGLMITPAVSNAATYHYINIYGIVQGVEASNPFEALVKADAQGQVLHSGVRPDMGLLNPGEFRGATYMYADIYGNLKTVNAASPEAVALIATDKHPQSGFIVIK